MTRWASVAFGAGIGIGSAYAECSNIFDGSPAKSTPPKTSNTPEELAPPKTSSAPAPLVG